MESLCLEGKEGIFDNSVNDTLFLLLTPYPTPTHPLLLNRKRRPSDKPIAVPSQLRPYFEIFSMSSENIQNYADKDIDDCLFNFLSPSLDY